MEGRNSPPTNYHIWIKSDNTINLFTNEQWQSLIDPNVKLELTNYINQQISNLKDGVSIDFDTLKEISDWINKHELDYVKILDQLETTVSDIRSDLNSKQNNIEDLENIRIGATKGNSSIQEIKTLNNQSLIGSGNINIENYLTNTVDLNSTQIISGEKTFNIINVATIKKN